MVPLAEYASVSHEATMFDAVMELEKAQQDFIKNRYPHRAVLVYDDNQNIIGKISQLDILRALEPQYEQMAEKGKNIERLGFSKQFLKSLMEQYKLWNKPFDDICRKAGQKKVKENLSLFMEAAKQRGDALDHVLLAGPPGLGKTTLARGFVRALGYEGEVRSPTFNLLFVYDTRPPVCHADLYRLNRPAEVEDLGLADYLESHILLVEWPERAPDFWPEDAWRVSISTQPDGARFAFRQDHARSESGH